MARPGVRRGLFGLGGVFGGGAFPMASRGLFETVVVYNTPGTTDINPAAGEDVQIDLAAIGNNVTVHFPAAPAGALPTGKGIGVTLLTELAGSTVTYTDAVDVLVSANLEQSGDCELFTFEAAASLWHMVAAFRRSAIVFAVPVVATPTDATPLQLQPGEYLAAALSSATDNVPVLMPTGGIAGQLCAVKCTAPAPVVTIPFEFALEPVGSTPLRIRGDLAIFVCTGFGSWELLFFEPGNAAKVFGQNVVDADLSGGTLSIVHYLNCEAPAFSVYDNTGALVPPGAGTWSLQINNAVSCTLTFDAGLLPLTGTWKVSAIGGATPDLS